MNEIAAQAFAVEIRKAMDKRGVTTYALAEALSMSQRHITWWRLGRSLPALKNARRVADALDWPILMDIVRRARTYRCRVCKRSIVSEGTGMGRRYCGEVCRGVARKGGKTLPVFDPFLDRLKVFTDAVGAFCIDCNPTGLCHDGACQLRAVSPLPLADGVEAVSVPVSGRKNRWDDPRERQRAADTMRAAHARKPDWREHVAAKNRERWAAMSAEERAALGQRISTGIRRRSKVA